MPPKYFRTKNVTVPPLVVLVLLDDRPGLVVDHPREATVSSQSGTVYWYKRTDTLKQLSL